MKILLVEDDLAVSTTMRDALLEAGHLVEVHRDGFDAKDALAEHSFDLLLADVRLPGMDGVALFRFARRVQPHCAAVLVSAYADIDTAVAVMREGAVDYLAKPFKLKALAELVAKVEQQGHFADALTAARRPERGAEPDDDELLVGRSVAMRAVRNRIAAAAEAGVNVLITGETGTGKELAARTLHQRSARSVRPFIQINCAAIPPELFESEMFGHERGAFTGAERSRAGRVAVADGGVLFLDEIGELKLEHQAKLLRVADAGSFERVGGDRPAQVDLTLISATNRDLADDVASGRFRRDLFFRLNVIEIALPPLRERRADIPLLAATFLGELAERAGLAMPRLTPAAMAALATHDYPGNVRELRHALEQAVALSRGATIDVGHLPQQAFEPVEAREPGAGLMRLSEAARQFERAYIERALDTTQGRRKEAARRLGISRKSLWQKTKKVGPLAGVACAKPHEDE